VPAEAGLGALGIFKFYHLHALNRFFTHAEETGGNLGYYMVAVWLQALRETAFTCAGKSIPNGRVMRFATIVGRLTEPKDMPPPYTGVEITTFARPSFLRLSGNFRGDFGFVHLFRMSGEFKP